MCPLLLSHIDILSAIIPQGEMAQKQGAALFMLGTQALIKLHRAMNIAKRLTDSKECAPSKRTVISSTSSRISENISLLNSRHPSVVLVDLSMPILDGT